MNLRGRNFLKLLDFTSDEIRYLLDLSAELKRMKMAGVSHRCLTGKNIVLLFEKTSTRTRCAFEVGAMDLGWGLRFWIRAQAKWEKKKALPIPRAFSAVCMTV